MTRPLRPRRIRVAGHWVLTASYDVGPDGRPTRINLTPAAVPATAPTPEEHAMTFENIKELATSLSPALAGEVVPLVAAGLRLRFPAAKPSLEADLANDVATLRAAYAAVVAAETSLKGTLADLK